MPCMMQKNSDRQVNKFKLWAAICLSLLKLRHHVIMLNSWISQHGNSLFFPPTTSSLKSESPLAASSHLPLPQQIGLPPLMDCLLPLDRRFPPSRRMVSSSQHMVGLLPQHMVSLLPPSTHGFIPFSTNSLWPPFSMHSFSPWQPFLTNRLLHRWSWRCLWVSFLLMDAFLPFLDRWSPPSLNAQPPSSIEEQPPPSADAWPPPSTNGRLPPLTHGLDDAPPLHKHLFPQWTASSLLDCQGRR